MHESRPVAAHELAARTSATRLRLARAAEDLLGAERAAELADRIALLASHVALVTAHGIGRLSQWAGQAGTVGDPQAKHRG